MKKFFKTAVAVIIIASIIGAAASLFFIETTVVDTMEAVVTKTELAKTSNTTLYYVAVECASNPDATGVYPVDAKTYATTEVGDTVVLEQRMDEVLIFHTDLYYRLQGTN